MKKIHYAWVICFAGMLLIMCNMGLSSNILSIYLPFLKELGYSGAQGSAMISIRCISSFLCTFLVTAFYRRFSLRQGMVLATLLSSAGAVICAVGGSIWVYYAGVIVMGVGYGFGTVFPCAMLIGGWFHKHKGLALGITSMGSGLASVIFSPLLTAAGQRFGLWSAFGLQAGVTGVCALLLLILVRSRPEEMGLLPFGASAETEAAAEEEKAEAFSVPRCAFFLQLLMLFLLGGAGQVFSSHLSILSTTCGYSMGSAALVATLFGAFLIVGKFSFGEVADRLSAKRATVIYIGIYAFSCLLTLPMNGTSALIAYAFAGISGIGCAFFNVGMPMWAQELSPKGSYASTLKWYQILYSGGGIVFTALPGRIADRTGEYKSSYLMLMVMALIAMLLLLDAYRRRAKLYR